jgi:hypothetical protein
VSELLPAEHGRAPLRGTQSFVAVMGRIWRTPSLTGIEVLWRWLAGSVLLVWFWGHAGRTLYETALTTGTVSIGFTLTQLQGAAGVRQVLPLLGWLALWTLLFSLGRSMILRRLGSGAPRWSVLAGLTVLRLAAFGAVLAIWFGALGWMATRIRWSGHIFASDQNLVGAFAVAVVLTLALFMFWGIVSWRFWLTIVIAAEERCGVREAFRRAAKQKAVRSKLVEISLVMGIVKVSLLVLALTFSACPLPFEDISTPSFLTHWWIAVGVLYLLASDFFHVVRLASYLALYRAMNSQTS